MPQPFFPSLKFADNIHYKFKSIQASKAMLQSSKHSGAKQNLTQNGQYSADHGFHGPLPHISVDGVIQEKYSINSSVINM